jgi:hypothetical protein
VEVCALILAYPERENVSSYVCMIYKIVLALLVLNSKIYKIKSVRYVEQTANIYSIIPMLYHFNVFLLSELFLIYSLVFR